MKRSRARMLIVVPAALLLVGAAVVAWHLRERRATWYTDADTIREPESRAQVRDILWQPAVALPETINTGDDEYEPRLTDEGATLLLVRGTPGDNSEIYTSRKTPDGWTEPEPFAAINSPADELGPEPSPDGRSIYFYSNRAGGLGGYDIWVLHRDGDGWGAPRNLGPNVNSAYHEYAPSYTESGTATLYFASNRPGAADVAVDENASPTVIRRELGKFDYDLYAAESVQGIFESARPLDRLNSEDDEGGPAVSPAGDFLYFASNRTGGEGGFDLYRARRLGDAFEAPANLGDTLNSPAHEMDPAVCMGGFGLHFSSDRMIVGDDAEQAGYDLYFAASREVFRDITTYRASIDVPALWAILWPYLLWLLISLLLMLALVRFARTQGMGHLNLLARCLLGSLIAHMVLLMIMAYWQVTTSISDLDRDGAGTRVVLTSPSIGREVMGQIRGQLTEVTMPSAMDAAQPRQETEIRAELANAMEQTTVAQATLAMNESMTENARPDDAPSTPAEAEAVEADRVESAEALAVDLPARPDREAIAEATPQAVQPTEPTRQAQANAAEATPSAQNPAVSMEVAAASSETAESRRALIEMPRPVETTGWSEPAPDQAIPVDLADAADALDLDLPTSPDTATERSAETERTVIARVDELPRQVATSSRAPKPDRQPVVQLSTGANSSPDMPRSLATAGEAPAATGIPLPDRQEQATGATSVEPTAVANLPQLPGPPDARSAPSEAVVQTDLSRPASGKRARTATDASAGADRPSSAAVAIAPSSVEAPAVGTTMAHTPVVDADTSGGAASAAERTQTVASASEAVELRLPDALAAAAAPTSAESPTSSQASASSAASSSRAAVATANASPDDTTRTAELAPTESGLPVLSSQSLVRSDIDPARAESAASAPRPLPAPTAVASVPGSRTSLPMLEEETTATARSDAERPPTPTALAGVTRADIEQDPEMLTGAPTAQRVEIDVEDETVALTDRSSLIEPARHPLEDLPAATTIAMVPRDLDLDIKRTEPLVVTDLRMPTPETAVANPYTHRTPETKQELVERFGGSEATEQAVGLALEWLARHQSPDGRWDGRRFDRRCGHCDGPSTMGSDVALTGLSLLCFMAAGHSHVEEGPYQEVVKNGVEWMLTQQSASGSLMGRESMYSHGIATMAIAEAYGLSGDVRLEDPVRRASEFIIEARNRNVGGWRYEPGQVGDTSVMGWQVMALTSAKRAGIDIPDEPFDVARNWLSYVSRPSRPGLYAYQPGKRLSPAMTAEGMYVQQLLGLRPDDAMQEKSADYILQHLPNWREDANTYYWYYATLAMFQHGGSHWQRWNNEIVEELVGRQQTSGRQAGSWDPDGRWAKIGGRVYQTAICTLTLEVYYRYLPLYVVEDGEPSS